MAAKNSAHLMFASLFIGHRAPQRARQASWGKGGSKRRYSRSCCASAGGWAGAYDTRRAPSVSIPVNTRTNRTLCFSLAFPGWRSLEGDAWDDPSLVLLCRGLRPHFVAGCMGQIGAAERSAGRTASYYTTLFYTALIKHNFSRSWHRCGACCEGTSAALRVGAQ